VTARSVVHDGPASALGCGADHPAGGRAWHRTGQTPGRYTGEVHSIDRRQLPIGHPDRVLGRLDPAWPRDPRRDAHEVVHSPSRAALPSPRVLVVDHEHGGVRCRIGWTWRSGSRMRWTNCRRRAVGKSWRPSRRNCFVATLGWRLAVGGWRLAVGGWEAATWFGRRSWVVFTAYPDGIDVVDLGWAG
jgi:hypothetical protein